jgi:hypothetical protein
MRNGDLPNFCHGQGKPQFNASSSILNSVPLRIQLKDFMDEKAKINKDTVTKFKSMDKVLENINSKVTEVGSSNHASSAQHDEDARDASGTTCRAPNH